MVIGVLVRPLSVFCILLLSGCVGSASERIAPASEQSDGEPIVIALIDTGINPYVPIFKAPTGWAPPDEAVAVATRFHPSQEGDYRTRVEADEEEWNSVELGELVYFEGTRAFGISFGSPGPLVRDFHFGGHGTGTAFMAAREAPVAAIMSIQIHGRICQSAECLMDPATADAMEWAAAQPWIDVISLSLGVIGSPPHVEGVFPEMDRIVRATEKATREGKIVVAGSGNSVVPSFAHSFPGPPWVVAVGGVENRSYGESPWSSKGADVVANFTEMIPQAYSIDEMMYVSGTSFSTPIVAGTLANAWGLVREAAASRVVSPQELRDALNASAQLWSPLDHQPRPPPVSTNPWEQLNGTSLPVLAHAQMGWGYVDGSLAPEIARRILEQDHTLPPGKEQAQLLQPAWQQARQQYWQHTRNG